MGGIDDELKFELFLCLFFIVIGIIISINQANKIRKKELENYERRKKRLENSNQIASQINSNNIHSFMYEDIEKQIVKIDHTFSKEVFLNDAKEKFLKYLKSLTENDIGELKEFVTEEFGKTIYDRIEYNKKKDIRVIVDKTYIYNAFLYKFSKSTSTQVITVRLIAEMKTYEINENTQFITKGNKYATVKQNYEMQFERKTGRVKCKSCGAPVNLKDLSVCEYCNTPIEVENNDWKLSYINILKD